MKKRLSETVSSLSSRGVNKLKCQLSSENSLYPTFIFKYVRRPSDKHDMQLDVDRNLNSCVIEVKANAIIARQRWLSLEAQSTRVANFWPSLTLLFWYKLLKDGSCLCTFYILILKRV